MQSVWSAAAGCTATALVAFVMPAAAQQQHIGDQPEALNMRLVGYNDLQARSAYQPTIAKQGNRYIAYIGHHGGNRETPKPMNPLTGQAEFNGTSIVDVTDPAHPRYLKHIPGTEGFNEQGGAQMTRVCAGSQLPKGDPNKFYLLRVFGSEGHEIWDVTDPANPSLLTRIVMGLKDTHKSWWECDTGIAYLVSGVPDWRVKRMTQIFDLSDPAKPVHIRDFGLPGQEPGATGTIPADLHGPISTGPKGNRVYFGYGTDKGGVLQIVDREKLLNGPKEPTPENLRYPEISQLDMSAWNGAHTTLPMLQMPMAEFAKDKDGAVRDFVMIVDEQIRNECQEARQMVWFADVTLEKTPTMVSDLHGARGERPLLRPRRPLRLAFLEREHGTRLLQEGRHGHLLQRRRPRDRRAQPLPAEGDRLLHPGDHRGDRQALHPGRWQGALQGRDPDQQRRDRRSRLHLHRRPRQHRHAHPRTHRRRPQGRRPAVTSTLRRTDIVASISELRLSFPSPACGTRLRGRGRKRVSRRVNSLRR